VTGNESAAESLTEQFCGSSSWWMNMDFDAQRKNGASHVYEQLKHLVINYQIAPGRQLHPKDFIGKLKVSGTPIREAFHRLGCEQLLVSIPNKGFFSRILNLEEMKELWSLKRVLLQHAILSPRTQFVAPLCPTGREIGSAGEAIESYSVFIERLFEHVAYMSENKCLIAWVRNLNDRTHYVRSLYLEDPDRRDEVARQSQELVDSLIARNVQNAIDNLHEVLQRQLNVMPALVKEGLARSYALSPSLDADRPVVPNAQLDPVRPFIQRRL
jgi:DNA-binding GntR family transcriptional regulator